MWEDIAIRCRASEDRGRGDAGRLDSRYGFSFSGYQDPDPMGFRALRVLNEDWIAPGSGFGAHPHREIHREMEIPTRPLEGEREHRDSQGHRSRLTPGGEALLFDLA